MKNSSWKRDKELLSEAYGQLSSSDWDDMDPSVTGQGGDFPPLEKGQRVYVTYNDGSELEGVLDFDGVDLDRSNMFTLDGGKPLNVENIVNIGPVKEEAEEDNTQSMPETREELKELIEDTIREYLEQQQKDSSDVHGY